MLKKLVKLPVSAAAFVAAKVMGRNTAPPADPPPPPPRKPSPPKPAPAARPEAPAHEHTHDHGHGHDHDHAPAPHRSVSVSAEDTPNPNARKFSCSVKVVEQGSLSFANATEGAKHPIGKAVFAVGGVKTVFAVNDFVTVTKTDDADWASLTPRLTKAIKAALEAE